MKRTETYRLPENSKVHCQKSDQYVFGFIQSSMEMRIYTEIDTNIDTLTKQIYSTTQHSPIENSNRVFSQ